MKAVLDSSGSEQANQYLLKGVCAGSVVSANSEDGEVSSKEKHICNTCGKNFTLEKNLNQHLLIHSGSKRYKCDICEKTFSRSNAMLRHKKNHESEEVFVCNICGKVFSHSYGLDRHIKSHQNKKVYNCETCSEAFSKRSDLMMHAKTHPKKTYDCDICKKSFSAKQALVGHGKIHQRESFACIQCDRVFTRKGYLNQHLKNHQITFPCDHCEKTFQRKSELLHHVSVSHNKTELQSVREKPCVNDTICDFSKNITYTRGASALNVFSTHYFSPSDAVSGDLVRFFEESRSRLIAQIQEELHEKRGLKWYIVVKILLHRTASDGEEEKVSPSFRSVCAIDATPYSVANHVEAAFAKVHSSFAEFTSQGSNWLIDEIIHMELSCAKYKPLG